jgi:hypothetical protein
MDRRSKDDDSQGCRGFVLKWRSGLDPEYHWFIRGLKSDGTFYGEVAVRPISESGMQFDISGTIEADNRDKIWRLLTGIVGHACRTPEAPSDDFIGVLAEGPITHPGAAFVLTRGNAGGEAGSRFAEAIRIFESLYTKVADNMYNAARLENDKSQGHEAQE